MLRHNYTDSTINVCICIENGKFFPGNDNKIPDLEYEGARIKLTIGCECNYRIYSPAGGEESGKGRLS